MAIIERKRLIFTAIAVSLVGIITGLFLGGHLLPSDSARQQYSKKTTVTKTEITVVDGQGEHTVTRIETTTEMAPQGWTPGFTVTTPSVNTPTPVASTPVQGANEVWITGRSFTPAIITVPVGTTVTWISKSGDAHTVTNDAGLFNASLAFGQSFSYTFTERGEFSFYCVPHSEMGGTVYVK